MTDSARSSGAVEERVWTIYVCPRCGEHPEFNVNNVCPGNHSQSREGPGLPYMERIEVVPLSLLTQALEAIERHKQAQVDPGDAAFDPDEQLDADDRLWDTADALRAQLQTDS